MPSVLVLGGGLSGVAAAIALARAGWSEVTLVERGHELGGLAGTFERAGSFYPLAYHHVLHRDLPLLFFLNETGLLPRLRWRRIRMLFHLDDRFWDLTSPVEFLRFPMPLADKVRFTILMLRAFRKRDWTDWEGRNAADLVEAWSSTGVREAIFDRLTHLKFGLPCAEVSGAWLGARLHFREGSAPLGYIPGCNWTKELCDGLTEMATRAGVSIRVATSGVALHGSGNRLEALELESGERLTADLFVSTVPTEIATQLLPREETPEISRIRYTAVVSAICATRQPISSDFYWLNLMSLEHSASGLFQLNALNPSIGAPGEACLNFVTHVRDRHQPFFRQTDDELWRGYRADFRALFGIELDPSWTHLTRIPMYSPILVPEYVNPPVRSTTYRNLYFAGNYRTFPSVVTTGSALESGLEAADAILQDHGGKSAMLRSARSFRLRSMPRA